MSRSARTCFSQFLQIISVFLSFLMATISLLRLSLQTRTSPKAPLPMILSGSQSQMVCLARLIIKIGKVSIFMKRTQIYFIRENFNLYLLHSKQFSFLVLDLLAYQLLLLGTELQSVHLQHEFLPGLLTFLPLGFLFKIFAFYVRFYSLRFLLRRT